MDAELQQFAVNVWRAPEWISAAPYTDQLPNLFRHRRAAGLTMANLPSPEQAEALTLPADDRGGLEDGKSGWPAAPDRGEPDPEQAISRGQPGTLDRALEDAGRMAEGKDLQLQGGAGPKRGAKEGEKGCYYRSETQTTDVGQPLIGDN